MTPAGRSPACALPGLSVVAGSEDAPASISVLTRRLAAGEDAAFREFHALYFDRLYHFLLVVTRGDDHAAQDALQETLLRVLRAAREFQSEDVFWCWLKAIARNVARDCSRRRRRYGLILERLASFIGASSIDSSRVEDERIRSLIEEGLSELSEADRQLIEAKYLRGATVAELADANGLTGKAVESRLGRLRRQLADALLKKLRTP
jgi:RNA polymerase sigma-70 factor, ECF subfamily